MKAIIATAMGKENMLKKVSNLILIYSDKQKSEKAEKEPTNIQQALKKINKFWQKVSDFRKRDIYEYNLEIYLNYRIKNADVIGFYKWSDILHNCFFLRPFSEKILKLEKIKRRIQFGIENASPMILSDEEISTIS
jgi:hypothetical protein